MAKDTATPAKPGQTIRLYNRMDHAFHASVNIPAKSFADVPADEAAKLLEAYPARLQSASDAQRELNGAAVELARANAKIAELEKALADAKAKKPADTGL
jgi:hypothetical protein